MNEYNLFCTFSEARMTFKEFVPMLYINVKRRTVFKTVLK